IKFLIEWYSSIFQKTHDVLVIFVLVPPGFVNMAFLCSAPVKDEPVTEFQWLSFFQGKPGPRGGKSRLDPGQIEILHPMAGILGIVRMLENGHPAFGRSPVKGPEKIRPGSPHRGRWFVRVVGDFLIVRRLHPKIETAVTVGFPGSDGHTIDQCCKSQREIDDAFMVCGRIYADDRLFADDGLVVFPHPLIFGGYLGKIRTIYQIDLAGRPGKYLLESINIPQPTSVVNFRPGPEYTPMVWMGAIRPVAGQHFALQSVNRMDVIAPGNRVNAGGYESIPLPPGIIFGFGAFQHHHILFVDGLVIVLEDYVFAFPDDVLPGGGVRFCCHGIRRGFICLTTDKNDSYKYTFYKSKVHFIILDFQNLENGCSFLHGISI